MVPETVEELEVGYTVKISPGTCVANIEHYIRALYDVPMRTVVSQTYARIQLLA